MGKTAMNCVTFRSAMVFSAALTTPLFAQADTLSAVPQQTSSIEETIIVLGSRISNNDGSKSEGWLDFDAADLSSLTAVEPLYALRNEPGIQVARKGSVAGRNFISIRGGDENFTQVFLEQAKVNDISTTSGGSFDLASIDINFLERLEVLKRPSSAVYGADAIGGIVAGRLQSYDANTPGKIWGSLTGADEYQIGGTFGVPIGDYGLAVGASHYEDEGKGGETYDRDGFLVSLQSDEDASFPLRLAAYHARADFALFPETSGGFEFAELRELERESSDQNIVSLEATLYQDEQMSWNSSVAWVNREAETMSPGILVFGTPAVPQSQGMTSFDRLEANTYVSGDLALNGARQSLNYVVGANWSREDGTSSGAFDFGIIIPDQFELERDALGLYSELEYAASDRLSVTVGLRFDDFEGDSETTTKADLVYRMNDRIGISAHWSEGYKLPSFFALGSTLVGNPNLVPEESEHLSASLTVNITDNTRLRATRFQNRFENLIEFDPNLFTNINLSLVDVHGTEIEAIIEPTDRSSLVLFGVWNDYELNGDGDALRLRPERQMGLDAAYRVSDALSFGVRTGYTGKRQDNYLAAGNVEIDDFIRVDVSSAWEFKPNKRLKLGALNLFDESYEETFGNPVEGARLYLALEADF